MSIATHPTTIHPTAVVSPGARIGYDCFIGPYCIAGDEVQLGDGVRLESHCVVDGRTSIGAGTHVFPFVSIGLASQDLKYKGEPSETRIGAHNNIREFVTIHRGTAGGGMLTNIGGYSVVVKDALPFALTVGNHAKCYGLNITGMKRRGYSRAAIDALHHAFHLLLSAKLNTTQAVERIREEISDSPEVLDLLRFIEGSSRGVTK